MRLQSQGLTRFADVVGIEQHRSLVLGGYLLRYNYILVLIQCWFAFTLSNHSCSRFNLFLETGPVRIKDVNKELTLVN